MMRQSGAGITGPPEKLRQNETKYWQDAPFVDEFDQVYDSSAYTLTYVFAGASAAPVSAQAVPSQAGSIEAQGWQTTLSAAQAALLLPGMYWWQAILTAPANPPAIPAAVRIVAAEGEATVETDLASLTGTFDGRSVYEVALANAQTALTVWQSSGGRVKAYNIAGRQMTFQDDKEITALIQDLKGFVEAEKQGATGGDRRNIRLGFRPATSGTPAGRNLPWW